MTLEELLEQARPIARRLVQARTAVDQEQAALRALIRSQRESAAAAIDRGDPAREAHPNYEGAMIHWAESDLGIRTAEDAALRVAHKLEMLEIVDDQRVLALSAETRLELMLLNALAAKVGGN